MARRASSSTHPTLIISIVIAAIALIFGGKFFLNRKSSAFGDLRPLAVEELLQNGNSLRNNEYLVEGTVDERFFRQNSPASVVSVRVKSSSGDEIIPVKIPAEFNNLNIEREQRYAFKVKFQQGGIPVALNVSSL